MKSIFRNWIFSGSIILTVLLIVSGCSNKKETSESNELLPVTLTNDLTISANLEEALVGNFAGLAVSDDGTIYVADTDQKKIHVFSAGGAYQDSIGREGKGPGEFSNLDKGIRVEGDTLYTLQARARRVDLFDISSGNHIRSISIPEAEVDGSSLGGPQAIFPQSNGSLLVYLMAPHFFAPEEGSAAKFATIARLDASGIFTNHQLQKYPSLYPSQNSLVQRDGDGISIFRVSMYPEYAIAMGPSGAFYQAKTDSLLITKYSGSGERVELLDTPYNRIPYTSEDMDEITGRFQNGDKLLKAMNNAGVPEYWPAFSKMLIDDEGHCWVQLFKPGEDQQPWWVFDAEGDVKWEVNLPKDVTLYQIKQGKAYGIKKNTEALPAIQRYDVEF